MGNMSNKLDLLNFFSLLIAIIKTCFPLFVLFNALSIIVFIFWIILSVKGSPPIPHCFFHQLSNSNYIFPRWMFFCIKFLLSNQFFIIFNKNFPFILPLKTDLISTKQVKSVLIGEKGRNGGEKAAAAEKQMTPSIWWWGLGAIAPFPSPLLNPVEFINIENVENGILNHSIKAPFLPFCHQNFQNPISNFLYNFHCLFQIILSTFLQFICPIYHPHFPIPSSQKYLLPFLRCP